MSARGCVVTYLVLAGCIETIPLGRECPDQLDSCLDADVPLPPDNPTGVPPRTPDAAVRVFDGGRAPIRNDGEAGGVSVPPLFPALQNLSFDIFGPRGAAGSLTEDNDSVPPWRACQIGWSAIGPPGSYVQRPGSNGATVLVRPTDGETFLENVISPPDETGAMWAPLDQRLAVPLVRGRYAFRVDVQTTGDADVTVELWSGPTCQPSRVLARSARVMPGRWQPICLGFEVPADRSVDGLMLVTNAREPTTSGTRVFFDNVRADATCP